MKTDIIVSVVGHAVETKTRDFPVSKIVNAIQSGGKQKKAIECIRATFADILQQTGDRAAAKKAVDAQKKKLPGILWSGILSRRAKDALTQHSGLLGADLDQLGDRLPEVRAKLMESEHLYALFLSPTGDGLKAIFRVPADASMQLASFRAVEKHVRELAGVQIDGSCKDVARMCFFSFDPEVYYNPKAQEIVPLPNSEQAALTVGSNGAVDFSQRQRITTNFLGEIAWATETRGFFYCPGQHLHTTGNGERDCEIRLDGAPTIHCFHNHCRGIIDALNRELRSRIAKAERVNLKITDVGLAELPARVPAYTAPPLELLPPESRDYVCAASESLNVDVSYIFLPQLSSAGSAIGNARSIELKRGFIQPPIIWTGTIGRSGSRKSPALDAGSFPILEHERTLMSENRVSDEMYAEAISEWESKTRKERGAKPEPRAFATCLMDDLTLAALAGAIEANPRGVLVKKDELSHWFSAMDQFHDAKGADVSRWLSLHTGVFFGFDRRTDRRHFRLYHPRVGITGGIQPAVLARVLTQDFFERGLPARFLFAAPPMRQDRWSEETIGDRLRERVLGVFAALWELQPEHKGDELRPILLRLDAKAKAEFISYYDECGVAAVDADEREEAAWNKLSGYAARLALVGQLLNNPNAEVVTGAVMRAACELARWFGNEAARIYSTLSETDGQRATRRLIEFIQRREGAVTVRDLVTYYRPLKNKTEPAEQQLTALVNAGLGSWEPVPTTAKGGQPTRRFRLLQHTQPPRLRLQNPVRSLIRTAVLQTQTRHSAMNH